MKKILIIRSVSMQQLDNNLIEIKKRYPDSIIHLLTHEHAAKLAEKYEMIDHIIVYPYVGSFDHRRMLNDMAFDNYDIVIIPVSNITGNGFLNVLLFAKAIKAKEKIICNLVSEMKEVTDKEILLKSIKHKCFSLFSIISTAFATIITVPLLAILLVWANKKDKL